MHGSTLKRKTKMKKA